MSPSAAFVAPLLVGRITAQTIGARCRNASFVQTVAQPSTKTSRHALFIRMTSTTPIDNPTSTPTPTQTTPKPQLTLLYDSECPLCVKEVNFLRNRSNKYTPPTLGFVDIAATSYDPSQHGNISYETAMKRIHGIRADGTVLQGVPVFQAAYEAVGLGWIYAVTKIPGVGAMADGLYNVWADYRLRLTGRPELENIMQMRREEVEKGCR